MCCGCMIKWLYDHYALTALVSVYYMALVGYGTYQVFADVSAISGSAATAYATLMALPPASIGLIKWRLEKDNGPDQ